MLTGYDFSQIIYMEMWVRNIGELHMHHSFCATLNLRVFVQEIPLFHWEVTLVIAMKTTGQGSTTSPKNSFCPEHTVT